MIGPSGVQASDFNIASNFPQEQKETSILEHLSSFMASSLMVRVGLAPMLQPASSVAKSFLPTVIRVPSSLVENTYVLVSSTMSSPRPCHREQTLDRHLSPVYMNAQISIIYPTKGG
jgi:hypothetical protein